MFLMLLLADGIKEKGLARASRVSTSPVPELECRKSEGLSAVGPEAKKARCGSHNIPSDILII